MAFYSKKFVKLTGKWAPVVKSVSTYDAKRLAKDIEKESTVSQTDVMAVASWDNHCDALTAKGRNTAVCFYPFCVFMFPYLLILRWVRRIRFPNSFSYQLCSCIRFSLFLQLQHIPMLSKSRSKSFHTLHKSAYRQPTAVRTNCE